MLEVIARVDDNGEVFRWEDLGESVREFRAADTARESDNATMDG